MQVGILIRLLLCVLMMGLFLYAYIVKQNSITELRLQIPSASRELQTILQENTRLQFEIDRFMNPRHLMELAREPRFSHLKHPLTDEVVTIEIQKEEK